MTGVHFGAGNIGRGFIGETLFKNGFHIDFVDVNETIVGELERRGGYAIELAGKTRETVAVENVGGINSKTERGKAVAAIANADLVTTAIGPSALPLIAELVAEGIAARRAANKTTPLDVIACENMIGGSRFLFSAVEKHLSDEDRRYVERYVGFPNAAVDRIVPAQHNEDPLFVRVEDFKEWIVDDAQRKAKHICLNGVEYVPDLEPYIERKLFSVNTGHATVAYAGFHYKFETICEAGRDERVLNRLKKTLAETGALLIDKWGFDKDAHQKYLRKIIERFSNPHLSDDIGRVARAPLRKLSFNERFIRPIRELKERKLRYENLLATVEYVFQYYNPDDIESVTMRKILKDETAVDAVRKITGLQDEALIIEIAALI
jgi:mannitol-1-phosphate 5-dehydrogenase